MFEFHTQAKTAHAQYFADSSLLPCAAATQVLSVVTKGWLSFVLVLVLYTKGEFQLQSKVSFD